ncbi:substrate-binding domain-containing protein [Martelella alba]|nr:substrate-binding domain-containing protein [Martelella alba]
MNNPTALRLHSALVVRSPFDASLLNRYRGQFGPIEATWTPTTVLMKEIDDGLQSDVVIVTDPAMEDLIARGLVDATTRKPLVVSRIGFAVKQGAAKPDIADSQKLRQALLSARSLCYSIGGASGIHFKTVLRRLGIEAQVDAKACPVPQGFTAEKLITGEADMAVQQISELLVVPGIDIVGPLPGDLQKATSFSIALFAAARDKPAGAALIEMVTAPDTRAEYGRFGLDCRF